LLRSPAADRAADARERQGGLIHAHHFALQIRLLDWFDTWH